MTANHPIRRLLARVCSADTMAQIVDPILADIRWETGRAAWLGYFSLVKAIAFHAVISLPAMTRRAWSDDDHAMPRAAVSILAIALVTALPLTAMPLLAAPVHRQPYANLVLLLMPQALVLAIPAALLLAIPLALRNRPRSARLARRTMGLAVVWSLTTLPLVLWGVPSANQAFRVAASGNPSIERGVFEKSPGALREQIDVLKLTPGGRVVARRLEYSYQVRVALGLAPLSLALLGLAISASRAGNRWPWRAGGAALILYVFGIFPLEAAASGLLLRASSLPPLLFAWMPNALTAGIALLLFSRYHSGFFGEERVADT